MSRFGWAMSFKELPVPFSPRSFHFSVVALVRRIRRASYEKGIRVRKTFLAMKFTTQHVLY